MITGQRVLWFMNGTTHTGSWSLGVVGTMWKITGSGDFNGDGKSRYSLAEQQHGPARDLVHEWPEPYGRLRTWGLSQLNGTWSELAILTVTANVTFFGRTTQRASVPSG